MKNVFFTFLLVGCSAQACLAKPDTTAVPVKRPVKISHAEPLYIDLVRDLGARKGEREWNAGWGINDEKERMEHTCFAEYEFAPFNRVGMEVEIPFTLVNYSKNISGVEKNTGPEAEGIKLAVQYTFLVSEKYRLSAAAGHIYEMEFFGPAEKGLFRANLFNPFLVVAKRWGKDFHSLVYTGPVMEHNIKNNRVEKYFGFNFSMHYVMPGTRNFIGMEINREYRGGRAETFLRPQVKLSLSGNLAIGFVTGIPLHFEDKNLSFFTRLIYEPGGKRKNR